MSTMHRAQILLESEQHEALAAIAHGEGRSISELVREIVRQHLAERDDQAQRLGELRALEGLVRIRKGVQEARGVYQGDLLAEVRAEREEDLERMWRGEP
jgi:Arc/MetJ-type ribon-helix-helix transcriptional regulator